MASFSEAFRAARKRLGAGKTFTWNGKKYSTNLASEVKKKDTKNTRPKARPAQTAPKTSPRPPSKSGNAAPKADSKKPKARPTGGAKEALKIRTKRRGSSGVATGGAASSKRSGGAGRKDQRSQNAKATEQRAMDRKAATEARKEKNRKRRGGRK